MYSCLFYSLVKWTSSFLAISHSKYLKVLYSFCIWDREGLQHKRGPSLSPNEIAEWSNLGIFFIENREKLCPIWCVCFNDCFTRRHFPVVFYLGKKGKNLPNDLVWKEIWKMTELLKITQLNVRKKIVSNAWTAIYTYTRLFFLVHK